MEVPKTPFHHQQRPGTARSDYDAKRRHLARLTRAVIRNLDVAQIEALRLDWAHYKDSKVSLAEFVKLMLNYSRPDILGDENSSQERLVQVLIELFNSMKLIEGRRKLLSFNTFLSTIVYMGHTDLNAKKDTRSYVHAGKIKHTRPHQEQIVQSIPELGKLMVCEPSNKTVKFFDFPSLRLRSKYVTTTAAILTTCYVPELDLLVGSTPERIMIWEGINSFQISLVEEMRTASPVVVFKWIKEFDRLYAGDMDGNVVSWMIKPDDSPSEAVASVTNTGNTTILLPSSLKVSPLAMLQASSKDDISPAKGRSTLAKKNIKRSLTKTNIKANKFTVLGSHRDATVTIEHIASMGLILTGSLDGSIRMWDLETQQEKFTAKFAGHRCGVVKLAYSEDYRFLLSGSIDHSVGVWHVFDGKLVTKLVGHRAPLVSVQFMHGTPQIISADSEGWIRIWDTRDFTLNQYFRHAGPIYSLVSCPEAKQMVVTTRDGSLNSFTQQGALLPNRGDQEPILAALWNNSMATFITAGTTTVQLWNGMTGRCGGVYHGLLEAPITAICLDNQDKTMIIGDKSGKIRQFNVLTGAYIKDLDSHKYAVTFLCYTYDDTRVISAAHDHYVKVHDDSQNEAQDLLMEFRCPNEAEIACVAYGQQHHSIAVASADGIVYFYNTYDLTHTTPQKKFYKGNPAGHVGMEFLHDYPILAICEEKSLHLWSTTSSTMAGATPLYHLDTSLIKVMKFDFQDETLYCGFKSGAIEALGISKVLASFGVEKIAVKGQRRPKCEQIAIPENYKPPIKLRFEEHDAPVTSLCLTPHPRALVSAAKAQHATVWSIEDGAVLGRFEGTTLVPDETVVKTDDTLTPEQQQSLAALAAAKPPYKPTAWSFAADVSQSDGHWARLAEVLTRALPDLVSPEERKELLASHNLWYRGSYTDMMLAAKQKKKSDKRQGKRKKKKAAAEAEAEAEAGAEEEGAMAGTSELRSLDPRPLGIVRQMGVRSTRIDYGYLDVNTPQPARTLSGSRSMPSLRKPSSPGSNSLRLKPQVHLPALDESLFNKFPPLDDSLITKERVTQGRLELALANVIR